MTERKHKKGGEGSKLEKLPKEAKGKMKGLEEGGDPDITKHYC